MTCLRWALRAALAKPPPPYNPKRPRWYPTEDGLSFQGIDAPTPISQMPKVEKQNNLAINVFGWYKGVTIQRLSKQPQEIPRIKNLNRLLYDQSKHRDCRYFCERCLHVYVREDILKSHRPECRGIGQTAVRVETSEKSKNKLTFQNHHKQLPARYIIYADFEALTTKVEGPELDHTKSNTQRIQHHEACSFSYIVVQCDGQIEPPVEYHGPNAAEHFLESPQEEESKIKGVLADPKAMGIIRCAYQ